MPQLFFTWIRRPDKQVHFEFLDNSVRQGERPRTAAFGCNRALNVLDAKCMLDVERFRKLHIEATSPESLFPNRDVLQPERNTGFIRDCLAQFEHVNFAEAQTGRVYLRIASGQLAWADRAVLQRACEDPDVRAAVLACAPDAVGASAPEPDTATLLSTIDKTHTVGTWGEDDRAG